MEDWRRLKMAGSSSGFAEFMNNEDIINPPGVALVLEKMYADQANLRAKQVRPFSFNLDDIARFIW